MEVVFFDKVTGKVNAVCHQPQILSKEEKEKGIEVESYSPPSDPDEYFDWEARVVNNQLTWEKKAKPINKFQFRKLFTLEELAKIKSGVGIAESDIPVLDVVREDLELFDQGKLDDPHVVEVIDWLRAKNIIQSNNRKSDILQINDPIIKEAVK